MHYHYIMIKQYRRVVRIVQSCLHIYKIQVQENLKGTQNKEETG